MPATRVRGSGAWPPPTGGPALSSAPLRLCASPPSRRHGPPAVSPETSHSAHQPLCVFASLREPLPSGLRRISVVPPETSPPRAPHLHGRGGTHLLRQLRLPIPIAISRGWKPCVRWPEATQCSTPHHPRRSIRNPHPCVVFLPFVVLPPTTLPARSSRSGAASGRRPPSPPPPSGRPAGSRRRRDWRGPPG